jgi:hypothetical protein
MKNGMKEIQEAINRLDQLRIDITKVENDDKVERDAYEIQQLLFKAMDAVTEKKDEKAFAIHKVSNSTLIEVFEDAICDRTYNPTNSNYNKSGYTYAELKAEIIDRLESERA